MSRLKKPFSELFGVSPGDYASPGVYRIAVLFRAVFIILTVVSLWCFFSVRVDAATVSGNDSESVPQVTESPTPKPTSTPAPTASPTLSPASSASPTATPEYIIENEVNLDGANLYGDAANVVLYAQEVILASETEGEMDASAFPEKSGYFVVPVSGTQCVYVPDGYTYWIVYAQYNTYYSCVSNSPLYLCEGAVCGECGTDSAYRYSWDGGTSHTVTFSSSNVCEHGLGHGVYWNNNVCDSVFGGNYFSCNDSEEILLESIVMSYDSLIFEDLSSQSLTAAVTPEDFSGTLTWTSTDESVAKYSGGLVIPVADGTCQIIASYVNPDGTVISASCDVTVALPVVDEEPTELDVFLQEPVEVDRYQYEILKRLEFIQYALAIQVALIFILIFKLK